MFDEKTGRQIFRLNEDFIRDHIDELVQLEDCVPLIVFKRYGAAERRDNFLKSKNMFDIIHNMDQLVYEKCNYYEDTVKAVNSVLIEWLNLYPEFEGIIADESVINYQNMKNNNDFIEFIDLLYDVELPSEKEDVEFSRFEYNHDEFIIKDDSNSKYPNFNKMDEILDLYPNCLLGDYLAYIF